jgi:hypothetical protein
MSGTSVYVNDDGLIEEVDDRRTVEVGGQRVAVTSRSQWLREAMLVRLLLEDVDEWEGTLARAKAEVNDEIDEE